MCGVTVEAQSTSTEHGKAKCCHSLMRFWAQVQAGKEHSSSPLLSFTHILLELSWAAIGIDMWQFWRCCSKQPPRLVITATKHPSTEDSSNIVPVSLVGTQACALCGVSLQGSLGKRKLFSISAGPFVYVCVCTALKLVGFSRTENVVKSIKRAATWPEQSSINFLNAAAKS